MPDPVLVLFAFVSSSQVCFYSLVGTWRVLGWCCAEGAVGAWMVLSLCFEIAWLVLSLMLEVIRELLNFEHYDGMNIVDLSLGQGSFSESRMELIA